MSIIDRIYGFWDNTRLETNNKEKIETNTIDTPDDDGAININGIYSSYSFAFGSEGSQQEELINQYRKLVLIPEVDFAVDDIINEVISSNDDEEVIKIDIDSDDMSDNIKEKINEEFKYILGLMDFNNTGYNHIRDWYVDGRAFYHKVIDKKNLKKGLIGIRKLDAVKVTKMREIDKDQTTGQIKKTREYFIFDASKGVKKKDETTNYGYTKNLLELPVSSVSYINSGLSDVETGYTLSHLHKAIKVSNQLSMLEDAVVIYRIARAPERRVFYVDVGSMPKSKAEQYMNKIMSSYRNKLVYDSKTGTTKDQKHQLAMMEDIWLPRMAGSKGTEIDTLAGGQNLGEMDDVEYFKAKLYKSLNLPVSRLEGDSALNFGRASEITRDELKLAKFISRLRKSYNNLFIDLLKTQLIIKKIITPLEWVEIKDSIKFIYAQDFYVTESKEFELMRDRLDLANEYSDLTGKYVSHEYIRRKILKQTDDEMKEIDKDIKTESSNKQYNTNEEE